MTVDEMIDSLLRKEGGYQKWPEDSGNWIDGRLVGTNRGVTPTDLAEWRGTRRITEGDMRALTEAEARAIFRAKYYERFRLALLPDVLEPAVLDFVVNSGAEGIKALQRTLTAFGYPCKVDGGIGAETMRQAFRCLDDVPAEIVIKAYLQERRAFLARIVERRPDQRVFLDGWYNRVDELERELT